MDEKVAEHISKVLKAMAHPIRLKIVELLQNEEMCVGDIVKAIGGKQSITSQQLCGCGHPPPAGSNFSGKSRAIIDIKNLKALPSSPAATLIWNWLWSLMV